MPIILLFAGAYFMVMGILMALAPAAFMRLLRWLLERGHLRTWGVSEAAMGVLLIWASVISPARLLVQILGGLLMLEGAYLMMSPQDRCAELVEQWQESSPRLHRIMGLLTIAMSAVILGAAVR